MIRDRAFTIDLATGDVDPMPTDRQHRAAWVGWLDRNSLWTREQIDAMGDRQLAVHCHGIAGNLEAARHAGVPVDALDGVSGFGGAS